MKVKEVSNIDIAKYKAQKNVRRLQKHEGGFEKIVFATDQKHPHAVGKTYLVRKSNRLFWKHPHAVGKTKSQ